MTAPGEDIPVVFDCGHDRLIGIIASPAQPAVIGVVIVVGGPQYRAGSHRQFTLLARHLATQGFASIRFDYRGMGDSEGDKHAFTDVDADIRAAIDTLMSKVPSLKHIALWGLCDAASASLYYAPLDDRVTKLILLNPWVHTESLRAQAQLKYYYLRRLLQRDFWRKFFSGQVAVLASLNALLHTAQQVWHRRRRLPRPASSDTACHPTDFIARMRDGLEAFNGECLLILSGDDLTAQEFLALCQQDKHWLRLIQTPQVSRQILVQANHTFSTREWRDTVAEWTVRWLKNEH